MNMPQTLERSTFQTSRLLEFFSEKELQMQIGFAKEQWPIALLKELIDNALDACESAGVPPEIEVTVEPDRVSVRDHGPGLPVKTLKNSLNYLVRVSDKAHYVSPSRGQLGNALKCLWAAPYVAHGEQGSVEVVTRGSIHRIAVTLDRIAQRPHLEHTTSPDGFVKNGTLITLVWPGVASLLTPGDEPTFYKTVNELLLDYAAFNPHATFTYRGPDGESTIPRTTPDWQKWRPCLPTSAHWYSVERLRALIAAYLTEERYGSRRRTVREFVAEFAGLSGSLKQKAVLDAAGLSRACLFDLVEHGDVSVEPVNALLTAMQHASRPLKPAVLGVLGETHLRTYLVRYEDVKPTSLKYHKVEGMAEGLPFVLELACGWYTGECSECAQQSIVGVNWSPALKSPFPRLQVLLGEARVDSFDPVVVLVHLVMPRPDFTDRGKSTLALPGAIHAALVKGIAMVTKHWKALKRRADKDDRVREREREHYLKAQQRQYLSIKEAAYRAMETAYLAASAQGTLPANARQIMYAARPFVLRLTGEKCWKRSSYFTQELLPDFIDAHPELTANWDVVFDDRGHLIEPHTQHRIGLGTLAVRGYIRKWHGDVPSDVGSTELDHDCPTRGPANRYAYALFVEKEGFYPLLEAARIAERYDIAIMSTKGMSVTAARQLVEQLSRQGVIILVCHDFDASGFSILHTLQSDTRRYQFTTRPKVVDLGLRLADVQAMNLQSEPVDYHNRKDPRINLRRCGAMEEECNFLVRCRGETRPGHDSWSGERVELNAMTSGQFMAWLERKLVEIGVQKVIPDRAALANAYRRAVRQNRVQEAIEEALTYIDEDEEIPIPNDLEARIREQLNGSAKSWDQVLWELAAEGEIEADDQDPGDDGSERAE
jgi:DNA topoisomerase VI subunit B